jgi:DNA-binding CsgD family transcriptional regulator
MLLWKLLIAINIVAWYCPVYPFRRNKFFLYFLINSLADPIFIALFYAFHIQCSDSAPLVIFIEALTFPLNDAKSKTISSAALLGIILNPGLNKYLEMIICEVVLAIMTYNLIEYAFNIFRKESALFSHHILLFVYFLRNSVVIYLFYMNQVLLLKYFTILLAIVFIIPVLLTYWGPEKRLKVSLNKKKDPLHKENRPEIQQLHLLKFDKNEIYYNLTPSEIRVLYLLGEGYKNSEISQKLFISKRTVYFHCQNLKNKLNIDSSARLRIFAIENHINGLKTRKPAHIDSIIS